MRDGLRERSATLRSGHPGASARAKKGSDSHDEMGSSNQGHCEHCAFTPHARASGKSQDKRSSSEGLYTCPMHPEIRQEGLGACPKCGMALEPFSPQVSSKRTEWTCPMHPEVVQDKPGACAKCGMALEPRTVVAEGEEESSELADMRRRFWVSVFLSVPVFVLAMGDLIPGKPLQYLGTQVTLRWVEFILATPAVLWCGWPLLVRGVQSVINRSLNMFTLIGLGVSVAYFYSVIALLFPHIFPPSFRSAEGLVEVYFEAAAVIVTLVLLGQVLELRARSQTSDQGIARAGAQEGQNHAGLRHGRGCVPGRSSGGGSSKSPTRRENPGRWDGGGRLQLGG
jgi:cation transport ATPase